MSKGLKLTILIFLSTFIVLTAYLFIFYLPGIFEYSNYSNEQNNENDTYKREKHVILISNNLSNSFEHQTFLSLKSMFSSYDNILITIFDSEGSKEKQQSHLASAFSMKADVVVVDPISYNIILPDIKKLYNNGISVITLGNHQQSPYYISMGFTPTLTGQLLAQSKSENFDDLDTSVVSYSPIDRNSSAILSGFTAELKKYTDETINSIIYTVELTDQEIIQKLDNVLSNECIIVQDIHNLKKLYDMIISKGYSGKIIGIIQSYDNLSYIIDNDNVVFILQDPELFNKQLFNTLLDVFKNPMESQHIEISQVIVDKNNISEYFIK